MDSCTVFVILAPCQRKCRETVYIESCRDGGIGDFNFVARGHGLDLNFTRALIKMLYFNSARDFCYIVDIGQALYLQIHVHGFTRLDLRAVRTLYGYIQYRNIEAFRIYFLALCDLVGNKGIARVYIFR